MKEPRIKLTEEEKLAANILGTDSNRTSFNMKEYTIDNVIQKEKTSKFNNEVEQYEAQLEENNNTLKEAQSQVSYDINKAEIKPMFARLLVKPFKVNPFQKMEVKNGIIVDTGGYTPHLEVNPMTGKYEEQKQFIITGCVVEIGPEVKYLKEGDVIYYRVDTAVPVPFLKQGLVSINENQVISVVAEGLSERFDKINQEEDWVDYKDLDFLGDTLEEKVKNYLKLKENGIKLVKE